MHFILFLITLISCSTNHFDEQWMNIEGRLRGIPIYRAKIPHSWRVFLPDSEDYFQDTTLPILSCAIPCNDGDITITIHNFPTQSIEESVPAYLQVKRWQNQFNAIDPASLNYAEIAYSGFKGCLFEATGTIKNQAASMLAIAMQIIPEHYRMLQNNPLKEKEHRQMRADYTIKAVGSREAIASKKEEILLFAESFELIHPIPCQI